MNANYKRTCVPIYRKRIHDAWILHSVKYSKYDPRIWYDMVIISRSTSRFTSMQNFLHLFVHVDVTLYITASIFACAYLLLYVKSKNLHHVFSSCLDNSKIESHRRLLEIDTAKHSRDKLSVTNTISVDNEAVWNWLLDHLDCEICRLGTNPNCWSSLIVPFPAIARSRAYEWVVRCFAVMLSRSLPCSRLSLKGPCWWSGIARDPAGATKRTLATNPWSENQSEIQV